MIGKSLAHYEIAELLGKGGMGEVYRAHDTKLNRDVALKLLPEDLANDVERLARFRREAQVLASLNHPNVAGIYGLEEAEKKSFLIMELAEGEDLSQRLEHGAFPLDEALSIARQIAEGLEEAHEKNIVHRDLKPANVMLSRDGKVKILDFGLARAYTGDPLTEGDPATSPTITAAMTQVGMILGSAAYMSPEQAKGRQVDRRADIWAFGVVLFEMITGKVLFEAETVSETMACVMKEPIDWDRLPEGLPPGVRALLERCLERDPQLRLRDIGEARIHLQDPKGSGALLSSISHAAVSVPATEPARKQASWIPWALFAAACLALVLLALTGGFGGGDGSSSTLPLVRSALESPVGTGFHLSGANPAPVCISPDGTRVVYGARDDKGIHQLWLQMLSEQEPVPIANTQGAQYPFWAPDSRSIGYFAEGSLRIVDLEARTNQELIKATDSKGGTWFPDGSIVFSQSSSSGLFRVNITGGEPVAVTDLHGEPRADSHRHPRALPDGLHFLFAGRVSDADPEAPVAVMYGDLQGSPPKLLLFADGQAEYANGQILYQLDNSLFARPFDPATGELGAAQPTQIEERVGAIPGAALALFSASDTGTLVYHPGYREASLPHLTWYEISGERGEYMGEATGFGFFNIAPDGKRVAYAAYNNLRGRGDLWIHEIETGVRTRLTFEDVHESTPRWSPDGKTLYYLRAELGGDAILAMEPDGREAPRTIYESAGLVGISDISPDGKHLCFAITDTTDNLNYAMVMPVDGSSPPVVVDESATQSLVARFSPDGRWISYSLLEEEGWQVYLKTFPMTPRKWQISEGVGYWYDWDPTGRRIYYQWSGSELYYRELELSGSTPRIGAVGMLTNEFPSPLTSTHMFEVSPDGTRILVSDPGGSEVLRPARLVMGWPSLLKE